MTSVSLVVGFHKRHKALLASSAIAGLTLGAMVMAAPALAAGGDGGGNPGSGGADTLATGGTGATSAALGQGGGGGGAGPTGGGAGGHGGGAVGGTGGAAGATGGNATGGSNAGGGGGGGGTSGGVTAGLPAVSSATAGGNGGNGDGAGSGGGGGAGGVGATVTGAGNLGSMTGAITGNNGGAGGTGATGGNGGTGGAGLVLTNAVAKSLSIDTGGIIVGGSGGAGGTGTTTNGASGLSGAGIVGQNLSITMNGGQIDGGIDANSVTFTAGTNALIFTQTTSGLTGAIGLTAGSLDLSSTNAGGTTLAMAISGSGSVSMSGANKVTLTATNSYTGGTTVTAGTLALSGGGTLGATNNTLGVSGGTLDLGTTSQTTGALTLTGGTIQNGTLSSSTFGVQAGTISAVLSGAGDVSKTGAGTVTLSGANVYSGGTTVSAGTLALSGAGTLGTTANTLGVSGGTLDLGTTSQTTGALTLTGGTIQNGTLTSSSFGVQAGTISAVLAGAGALTKTGAGTVTLSGANTYTGQTTISNGTLALSGGTTTILVASSRVVLSNSSATFDISGTTSGATIRDLSGVTNSHVKLGSVGGLVVTNAASTYNGIIQGSGSFYVLGGSQTLGGFNTYTGGTLIGSGATLNLSGGSIASSSNVSLVGAGATFSISDGAGATIQSLDGVTGTTVNLGFQRLTISNASNTFAGKIQGSSGVTVTGGTQTLSGTNTYTGTTLVNGGKLVVDGSIATSSMTTVNAGATIGGSGTVGNLTINGGTLSPGNSPGTLNVNGNLVLTSAASYLLEVTPTVADRTNVTGTAALGGATVNAFFAAGSYVSKQYTIVNATGGLGGSTFSSLVNTNLPTNFASSLSYDANNAYLNLTLNFIAPTAPNFGGGLTTNQQNVANTLVNFFNTTGGIPLAFGALTPAGLTQVSGETATGTQQATFDAMNQFLGLMTDPFIAGRGDPVGAGGVPNAYADESLAYAGKRKPNDALAAIYTKAPPVRTFEQRWSVWAAGYGGSQTTSGDPRVLGSNDARSSIYGTAVGADYRWSPNTLAGFALAGGGTNFSVNGFGSGRSDLFQAGAFVRHNAGPAYISAALAYGWQDITTDRTVTVAGLDRLHAEFNANAWSGRVEGGYRFVSQGFGWTPYAAGQFTTFDLPNYAEQAIVGANTFALAYNGRSVTDSRSELGLRTDKSFAMTDGIFTLRGRGAWAHDFNPDRLIGATFQTLPGTSFVVNGARRAADSALVTGSAEMKWLNGWSAAATFEGEFSNVTNSYAGKGAVRYTW